MLSLKKINKCVVTFWKYPILLFSVLKAKEVSFCQNQQSMSRSVGCEDVRRSICLHSSWNSDQRVPVTNHDGIFKGLSKMREYTLTLHQNLCQQKYPALFLMVFIPHSGKEFKIKHELYEDRARQARKVVPNWLDWQCYFAVKKRAGNFDIIFLKKYVVRMTTFWALVSSDKNLNTILMKIWFWALRSESLENPLGMWEETGRGSRAQWSVIISEGSFSYTKL